MKIMLTIAFLLIVSPLLDCCKKKSALYSTSKKIMVDPQKIKDKIDCYIRHGSLSDKAKR